MLTNVSQAGSKHPNVGRRDIRVAHRAPSRPTGRRRITPRPVAERMSERADDAKRPQLPGAQLVRTARLQLGRQRRVGCGFGLPHGTYRPVGGATPIVRGKCQKCGVSGSAQGEERADQLLHFGAAFFRRKIGVGRRRVFFGLGVRRRAESAHHLSPFGSAAQCDALFGMMGVFAEFERAMIVERVKAGLAQAKAEGCTGGRPRVSDETEANIKAKLAKGLGVRKVALEVSVGTSVVQSLKIEATAK